MNPTVESFRDAATCTFSHIVFDRPGGVAAIIDPVLDYDAAAARIETASAERLVDFIEMQRLQVAWVLETHAHADHLTAGAYLRDRFGAQLAIGRGIMQVQQHCKTLFDLGDEFAPDGTQFDRLFEDGDRFRIGDLDVRVMTTPGHTADGISYVIGDAAFVGDTLFAPDLGTARCDFPGGDARTLYRSIRRLFELPDATRVFLCHDYPPAGREPMPMTTIGAQKASNLHVGRQTSEADYVALRTQRDATLSEPKLILPSLQVNIRGGRLPPPHANGIRYLRLPIDLLDG